jgi:hypothetical protein
MTEELRLYTFTLYQLSPIQQGIQAGHAAVELGMKCSSTRGEGRGKDWIMYVDWATNWKTMVLLNGGDLAELGELADFLASFDNPYPWESFYESEASLGGLLTSVAIIVPARIFETVAALRKKLPGVPEHIYPESFDEWELEFIDRLLSTGLAR